MSAWPSITGCVRSANKLLRYRLFALVAVVMRHIGGNYHRNLYQACHPALATPWGLVNHLAQSMLGDSVGIGLAALKHMVYNPHGALVMAVKQTFADKIAVLSVSIDCTVVHIQDYTLGITYRDSTVDIPGKIGDKFSIIFHSLCLK